MNIDPLDNSGYVQQPRANAQSAARQPAAPQQESDRLSAELSEKVRESLSSQPDIRPEVVERGRQLAADPNYPSPEIVRKIASLITPLSEE